MTKRAVPAMPDKEKATLTANDRFKDSFRTLVCFSVALATGVHFGVFAFWPEMTAPVISYASEELTAIELPPEIEIPPPPETVIRPAVPVIATGDIDEDITIAPTTFEENPVEELPPPPASEEVRRTLEREYPPILREAGLGGVVMVWFFIDEEGSVVRTLVHQSSGLEGLDEAALKVAEVIQFTPALNRDQRVPVWISLPITPETR
jgi:TonB family protein